MAMLKLVGYLADLAKNHELNVQLKHPTRLRELLPKNLPENRLIVLINQDWATLDSFVNNEDKVLLLPEISGG